MRYSEVENKIKDILRNSDKNIGVLIQVDNFFVKKLISEGFLHEEVIYTVRRLKGRGYFDYFNGEDENDLTLTIKGVDEWLENRDVNKKGNMGNNNTLGSRLD